jgi:uncharacterized membrane protein
MTDLIRLGRWFYAVAIAGFGVQFLVHAWFRGPVPGPPWVPGRPVLAYSTAIVLIAAAVCIMTGKKLRGAAMLLAIMLLLRALLIYAPRIAANPHDPGPWTSGFEILAMCGASLVIAGSLVGVGRLFFASLLVVVGIQHFLYARFIATLIPSWIPGHLLWAYFVGAAFFAAAISIISRRYTNLATTLLGLMFFLWVISLHLPRVAKAPHNGNEWTSMIVALAMCGGAWVMTGGGSFAMRKRK